MNQLSIVLFCTASLLGSLGLAVLLYPHASLPQSVIEENRVAQPMENFEQVIDTGDFGVMTVIELMAFYLDNPPQQAAGGSGPPLKERQFGGC